MQSTSGGYAPGGALFNDASGGLFTVRGRKMPFDAQASAAYGLWSRVAPASALRLARNWGCISGSNSLRDAEKARRKGGSDLIISVVLAVDMIFL